MKLLTFKKSKKILKKYEFTFPKEQIIQNINTASKFLKKYEKISLKLYSQKISHKTDKKLVFLEITTIPELKKALKSLLTKQKKYGGEIVAQEWIQGINLILGAKKDESFTKLVMIGSGGIYAELFKDTSFRIPPLKQKDINEMIDEIKISKTFNYRGKKFDVNDLKKNLQKISNLIQNEKEVMEMEINPLILTENKAFVVDIRVIGP